MMRNFAVLLIAFCFGATLQLSAKNYYVAANGNNANAGTSASAPWQTLAKVNSSFSGIVAGDSILFRRGDTFYGVLIIGKSGASGNPIVIGAYGSGAKPVISGFVTASSWSQVSSGIYQTYMPGAKSTLSMVTINGEPHGMGRYPNADATNGGYLNYESFSGATSITDNQLTSATNWTGAEIVVRKRLWVLDRGKITGHSGGTLSFTNDYSSTYTGVNGFGYFIQNDVRTLDQLGEWYYKPGTRYLQMYFGTASPNAYTVKVSNIDTLLNMSSKNYINIGNIVFEGANGNAIYAASCNYINIQNCDFYDAGVGAINFQNGGNLLIENCNTRNILSNAIVVNSGRYTNITIRGCNISHTGTIAGMGEGNGRAYKAINASALSNLLIEYNNVDTTGYVGIEFQGSNVNVRYNVVNYFDYVVDDAGGIYTYASGTDANPGTVYTNRVINNNIVMNGIGAAYGRNNSTLYATGIYMDGRAMNTNVYNNTVFNNARGGIHSNNAFNISITGNTSFNNLNAVSVTRWSGNSVAGLAIRKNILFPKTDGQRGLHYTNSALNEPVSTTVQTVLSALGDIDSNTHSMLNPTPFTSEIYTTTGGALIQTSPLSLEAWRATTAHDMHGSKLAKPPVAYKLTGLVGTNKFTNGLFNSNISGITLYGTNASGAWDNTGKISGGSLKISFTSPAANKYNLLHAAIGAVSASKKYVLRFSTYGTTQQGIVRAYIRKTASPYNNLVSTQVKTFGTGRNDHEFLFDAPTTDAGGSFVIEIEQNSGTTYIDNIEFYEANATVYDLDSQLRLEYNGTKNTKSVSLGGKYAGVDGTVYNGTVTLQPYTSIILIKDTSSTAVVAPPPSSSSLTARATAPDVNCYGGTTAVTVSASGGLAPYTGAGTFTADAGTGSYKLSFPTSVANTYTLLYYTVGAISSSKNYVLRFTTLGTTNSGSLRVSLRQTGAPWTVLTTKQTATYGTSRKDHEFIFNAPPTQSAASFLIEVDQSSGTTYLDNIAFFEADATGNPISDNLYPDGDFESSTSRLYTYSANNNQTASIDNTGKIAATRYYIIKDADNNKSAASVTISQPASPLHATASAEIINSLTGLADVVVAATGGTAPYTGVGTFSVQAGTYSYTITDAKGCTATASATVLPAVSTSFSARAVAPVISCYGGSTAVTVTATGGTAPYTGTGTFSADAGTGSFKISFNSSVANTYTLLYYTIGAISSSKNYVLRFTTLGSTNAGNLRVSLRQTGSPWTVLTSKQSASFGITRKDHEFVFNAPPTQAAASFLIEIDQASGTTYLDNIGFFEADAEGNPVSDNLYPDGDFESSSSRIYSYSANDNHTGVIDNTSKIDATRYFKVTDARNNISIAAVTISQPASPLSVSASAGIVNGVTGVANIIVSATGGTAPYTGTGTYSVQAGTYNYTVTDARGCSAVATAYVAAAASTLTASAVAPIVNCFGSNTTVTVSASGGTAPYTGTGNFTANAGMGSLKISFPAAIFGNYALFYYTIGAVSSSKNYVLKFTTVGTADGGSLRASLRQTSSPWTVIISKQTASFGMGRTDHEFHFNAPPTQSAASFLIEIAQTSGTLYLDNIAFFEADAAGNLVSDNLYPDGDFESPTTNLYDYSYNNNHTASLDFTGKVSGVHYYAVKDALNNISVAEVKISQPATPLTVTATSGLLSALTGLANVVVSATGGTAPYTGTGTFSVLAGTYTYTVRDARGCASTATVTVSSILSRGSSTGTSNATSTAVQPAPVESISAKALQLNVYPNPSASNFNLLVEGGSSEKVSIVVYSMDGKVMYQNTGRSNNRYSFGANLVPGVYILKAVQGATVQTLKLIKSGN